MKIHNDFTLYWQVFPSGKRVVYYYAYDTNDKQQMGWSTGETNMTAVRVKCNKLLKEGGLIPDSGYMPAFAEYAQGWRGWETCACLKKRCKWYILTQACANNNKKNLKNQPIPYFYLCKQFDEYGYRDTKTKDKHSIPLPENLTNDLLELKRMNGEGFVFSLDGGATPICRRTMYDDFHRALKNIGMSEDETTERHLHLHGWRYFFNTELLKGGLTIPQAQAVTGHKSERMTEWYFHFDATDFVRAKQVQEVLLNPDTRKPLESDIVPSETATTKQDAASGKPGQVLPFPVRENAKKRKQA